MTKVIIAFLNFEMAPKKWTKALVPWKCTRTNQTRPTTPTQKHRAIQVHNFNDKELLNGLSHSSIGRTSHLNVLYIEFTPYVVHRTCTSNDNTLWVSVLLHIFKFSTCAPPWNVPSISICDSPTPINDLTITTRVGKQLEDSDLVNTKTSDVYWTVHNCDNWRIRNQLDVIPTHSNPRTIQQMC